MHFSDDEQKDSYEKQKLSENPIEVESLTSTPPSKKQKLSENPMEVESVTSTPYLNTSENKPFPFSIENILSPEFRARKNSNKQTEQNFSLKLSDDEDFDAFENNETLDIKITNASSLSYEQWMDW